MNTSEFKLWLDWLDLSTITAEPMKFMKSEFDSDVDFALAMSLAGKRFVDEEDIIVRYAKPMSPDESEVWPLFQILRSKAKMFFNYMKNDGSPIRCYLSSGKDIKEALKFFNSLAVKGEDRCGLNDKEIDLAGSIKEALVNGPVLVRISLVHDNDEDVLYPCLTYTNVDSINNIMSFDELKNSIKKHVLKIVETQ